jgi:hypothetical protein
MQVNTQDYMRMRDDRSGAPAVIRFVPGVDLMGQVGR